MSQKIIRKIENIHPIFNDFDRLYYETSEPIQYKLFPTYYPYYFNDLIKLFTDCSNDTGNLAITSGNYLDRARKVGRQHQNVLVFYKGDTKNIKERFGKII